MGNALYVENNCGDIEILDSKKVNIRGGTPHISKDQAQQIYIQVGRDITRSITADGYVRMRPNHGKKSHVYRVHDKEVKVDFSRLYLV